MRLRLLANVCGEWCVQSQVLPNIRGRSRTRMLTERAACVIVTMMQTSVSVDLGTALAHTTSLCHMLVEISILWD